MRTFLKRYGRWLIAGAAALLLSVSAFAYSWIFADLPPLSALADGMALPSTRFYDRNGVLLFDVTAPQGGRNAPLALEEFPAHCVNAVISTEDVHYWAHVGVDVLGLARAVWINLRGGEVIAGGSTITQQTARLLLLDPLGQRERTLQRKLKEMVLALQLNASMSKEDVLALYMNQVYLGSVAYGFEAAAQAYFSKSARELSLAECALLAGMIQNAAAYHPLTRLEAAKARQREVLRLMTQSGVITAQQAELAYAEPLQLASAPFMIRAPHAVMTALQIIQRDYGEAMLQQGLNVTLTVDLTWTQHAQEVVRQQLAAINEPPTGTRPSADADNAALMALNPHTGEILVMLGSPDYFNAAIDGALNATLAHRQPGSTLKPFTYALAMDPRRPNPYTPATMLLDVHTPFVTRRLESYAPGNYGRVENGPVSVRQALASSYNIPAVIALDEVGVPALVNLLTEAGIDTLIGRDADLSITLGGNEVTLYDLAQAYAVFPRGGTFIEPALIQRVETTDGQLLYEYQPPAQTRRVLDERVAYLITHILSDSAAREPAFGAVNPLMIGRPAAAKTGTTTDYRDNWVVGYTPDLVVGVWVGNADNRPLVNVTGISGAGPIWNQFIRRVTRGTPPRAFPVPDGLVTVTVCVPSGLLPTAICPRTRDELFIDGTQPTQPDTWYQIIALDRRTGQPANAATPPEALRQQVMLVLPPEARDWALRYGIPQPPEEALPASAHADALRLTSPDPYTVFQLSNRLAREAQQLRLTVIAPPETRQIDYVLNGQVVASAASAPWVGWWPLEVGEFALVARATLADGSAIESAPVLFRVVPSASTGQG
ncbi:MAG: transglycosylase domain-containing protein [Anaerolinea sp.]